MATYKLDVVPQSSKRLLWIHRDQSEEGINNDSAALLQATSQYERILQRPLIQPIMQVCEGDVVEIAVNFFSLQGMLDIDSVEWFIPQLSEPTKQTVLDYDKDRHH